MHFWFVVVDVLAWISLTYTTLLKHSLLYSTITLYPISLTLPVQQDTWTTWELVNLSLFGSRYICRGTDPNWWSQTLGYIAHALIRRQLKTIDWHPGTLGTDSVMPFCRSRLRRQSIMEAHTRHTDNWITEDVCQGCEIYCPSFTWNLEIQPCMQNLYYTCHACWRSVSCPWFW